MRLAREADGESWSTVRSAEVEDDDDDAAPAMTPAPPAGFPCGHLSALSPAPLDPRTVRKHREPMVQVMVDLQQGYQMHFRFDRGRWTYALGQSPFEPPGQGPPPLPRGAALRPWVALTARGDECKFVEPFTRIVRSDSRMHPSEFNAQIRFD